MSAIPAEPSAPRSTQERLGTRYDALRFLQSELETVLGTLKVERERGLAPQRIVVRKTFARRSSMYPGPTSDRKLPPLDARPPSVRLIRPNGIAQSFFLLSLFVAQCETKAGNRFVSERRTAWSPGAPEGNTWSDLVAVPLNRVAEARSGEKKSGKRILEDNRRRQIQGALRTLAGPGQRLVHLPRESATSRQYDEFQLLDEAGVAGQASLHRYSVPTGTEPVFSLPVSFFLNGWHQVLTPSEIAFLMMLYVETGAATGVGGEVRKIEADIRLGIYTLSPAAYGSHRLLSEFGVLEVEYDDDRDPSTGQYRGIMEGAAPKLHAFRILEAGFDRPAASVVLPTLKARLAGR